MDFWVEFDQLRAAMPKHGMLLVNCENSNYCSYSGNLKNCYLLYGSEYDEDCLYGLWVYYCNDCVDSDYCHKCQLCYECIDCRECYNCTFCQDCKTTRDSQYCIDCTGCSDCFGCSGLRRRRFCIFNEQFDESTYKARLAEVQQLSEQEIFAKVQSLHQQMPVQFAHQANNELSSGDYIYYCKNSYSCFDVSDLEDCNYINNSMQLKDCTDVSNMYFSSTLNYEVMAAMNLYNCNFCLTCFDSSDLEFCEFVYGSKHCFGCVYQNHAQYKILNRQYEESEYFKKVAEIKDQLKNDGKYQMLMSPSYPYKDSVASFFWPQQEY